MKRSNAVVATSEPDGPRRLLEEEASHCTLSAGSSVASSSIGYKEALLTELGMTPELMRVMRPRNGIVSILECKRLFRMDSVVLGVRSIGVLSALALVMYFLYGISADQEPHNRFRRPLLYRQRVSPCTVANPCTVKIIADLDKQSRVRHDEGDGSTNELKFKSYLLTGKIFARDPNKYEVSWDGEAIQIDGKLNEGGRGMELSELIIFNNALLSFDDRTGVVYELTKDNRVVPRHVITEGDGYTSKGMKIEWATVKDDLLYIGSFGKEFTNSNGTEVLHENNFWVSTIDGEGNVKYNDWKPVYTLVRNAVGASFPGYVIHEAVGWSQALKKWVFLPRRISSESYDEVKDESRGSNLMILVEEDFSKAEVREVGVKTPTRGFSTFKFAPGTNDEIIVALKSEERCETANDVEVCSQKTFVTVVSTRGDVLMEELEIPSKYKYEGLEFIG